MGITHQDEGDTTTPSPSLFLSGWRESEDTLWKRRRTESRSTEWSSVESSAEVEDSPGYCRRRSGRSTEEEEDARCGGCGTEATMERGGTASQR
ncbi:hypothetical protein HK104_002795, partial [Borealophlyctis nickersoniae]